jgi:hypothetical protein
MSAALPVNETDARTERDRELREQVEALTATVEDLVARVLNLLAKTD